MEEYNVLKERFCVCFIGFGLVARTTLTCWTILDLPLPDSIVILEPKIISQWSVVKNFPVAPEHRQVKVTSENYDELLDKIQPTLVIDLSIHVDGSDILDYCQEHGIHYINTSQEDWPENSYADGPKDRLGNIYERSSHYDQVYLAKRNYREDGPTAVLDSGMNPGMISHFVKTAIKRIALRKGLSSRLSYGQMAKILGLSTIQVSERDSQVTLKSLNPDTFYNTWCCYGFYEEAVDPAQVGWGTYETPVKIRGMFPPPNKLSSTDYLTFYQRGIHTLVRGFDPIGGPYTGYCIPHGEAGTLPRFLSAEDYNPSVYYVYLPSGAAIASLNEVEQRNRMLKNEHVLISREIAGGYDAVGALLLFEDGSAFWAGTVVDNGQASSISDEINATALQVAGGVLSAVNHILHHPCEGVLFPEALDSEAALKFASPLLGQQIWKWVDWDRESNNLADLLV